MAHLDHVCAWYRSEPCGISVSRADVMRIALGAFAQHCRPDRNDCD